MPALARGQVHAAGEDVVVAEDRGDVLLEQRPGRERRALERERRLHRRRGARRAARGSGRAAGRTSARRSSRPRGRSSSWPSPSRWSSAASTPASTSSRTTGRPPRAHLDLDRVLGGAGREVGLEQQQPVGRPGEQRLQRRRLPRAIVADVDEHDRVAGALGGALGAAQHAPEERVRDVRHHERDAARHAGAQRAGGDVRAVAELGRGGADHLLGACGDPPAGFPGQHERDRRLRDAGAARDVDAGDAWRSADVRNPRATWTTRGGGGRDRRARARPCCGRATPRRCSTRRRSSATSTCPYWAELWPSALALARVVGVARAARSADAGAGLRARSAVARRGGRRRARAGDRLGAGRDRDDRAQRGPQRARRSRRCACPGRRPSRCSPARRGISSSPPTSSTKRATATRCSRCSRAWAREIWLADPGRPAAGPFLERVAETFVIETRRAAEIPQGGVYRLRLR